MNKAFDQPLNPFFDTPSIKRKYLAEAGLQLFSRGPAMFRPSDVYTFENHPQFRAALTGSNVYLIGRRRRITVDPQSIRVAGGDLYGTFRVHGDCYGEWESFHFSPPLFGPRMRFQAVRPADSFGHAIDTVDEHGRRILISSASLLAVTRHSIGDRTRLEVLYIGQTFGEDGSRIAADRLLRHTTLQRILAETSDACGQDEIVLLGLQYGNSKNILSSAGDFSVESSATEAEENDHLVKASSQVFKRKDRILLAEAGLINHFKPRYNIMHRDSFSRRDRDKLKTLRSLLKEDFSALIIEVNTSNIGAKLWTEHQPHGCMAPHFTPQKVAEMKANALRPDSGLSPEEFDEWLRDNLHAHVATFPMFEKSQRETFLHGLPWVT